MLHISTGGFRCEARAMKITIICCVPLELLLRHGHLSVLSIISILWMLRHGESALHLMHWKRRPYPPNTMHEHIRTTSSCRLLFVLRTYMSMLLDYVIQVGKDGDHRQWYGMVWYIYFFIDSTCTK